MSTKKVLVSLYRWDDLTRLAVIDMHKRLGLTLNADSEFHFIVACDVNGIPYLRLDLTPLPGIENFEP
jgi:hypothetical protein